MVQVAHGVEVNIVCNDLIQKGCHSAFFALVAEVDDWVEENSVSMWYEA